MFIHHQVVTPEQKELKRSVMASRLANKELSSEMRQQHEQHRLLYGTSRQPLLDGLASEFDLALFRDAQMMACQEAVRFFHLYILLGIIVIAYFLFEIFLKCFRFSKQENFTFFYMKIFQIFLLRVMS